MSLTIAIAGSSGQIGRALTSRLEREGHLVQGLVRGPAHDTEADWDPTSGWVRDSMLEGVDVVINFCGASIGDGRWSAERKSLLRSSRIDSTRTLVRAMAETPQGPRRLLNASAVGYYGDRGDEVLDEGSTKGGGFLADLVADWETTALAAKESGIAVTCLRFGVVLSANDGALGKMLRPFKLGLGGPLGRGSQWFPWVTLTDATRAVVHLLEGGDEIVNVVSPGAVTNRGFTKALGAELHRPAFLPIPRLALRAVLGESANELLFASQKVQPGLLLSSGFQFEHADIGSGLAAALAGAGTSATVTANAGADA